MVIRLDPQSDFMIRLESLYKSGLDIDAIINGLVYIYHPLNISFERPFDEKVKHVESKILRGIKYADLEKQGLVRLFQDECIPTELRYYADIKHILDKTMRQASEISTSSDKTSSTTIKAIRELVRDFNDLKETLLDGRQKAAKVSSKHTRGNELLSMRDQRELEDGD